MKSASEINKSNWDKAVLKKDSHFMQSHSWGAFREKMGIPVSRLKSNHVQIERRKLPLGKCYLYIVGNDGKSLIVNRKLSKNIQELAEKQKAIFIKIEPLHNSKFKIQDSIPSNNIQPKNTLILDISPNDESLLASFHQKHRYNIRLATKKNIEIKEIESNGEFEKFYKLIKKTNERKHISSFGKNYYKNLFELSGKEGVLKITFLGAYSKRKMIAGLILILWNGSATYLVGASDYEHRKLMAPHLLQWEAIKLAKKLGAKTYDFWGIIKEDDFSSKTDFERHHWAGITRFKMGFGGKVASFASAKDYIVSPFWYKLYQLGKKLKN